MSDGAYRGRGTQGGGTGGEPACCRASWREAAFKPACSSKVSHPAGRGPRAAAGLAPVCGPCLRAMRLNGHARLYNLDQLLQKM